MFLFSLRVIGFMDVRPNMASILAIKPADLAMELEYFEPFYTETVNL